MPLIVISGFPASGKTTRARELKKYFDAKGKKVVLISENIAVPKHGFSKNEYFSNSQSEKQIRSHLKSEALRLLNKEDVIILDAGNYIKGYRYELFCATKAARTTQCTLFCGIQIERAWEFNIKRSNPDNAGGDLAVPENSNVPYNREIFDALCMRFEEPHGNCRWDSPLFVVFPGDELQFDFLYDALFESKPLPPNQSTQNAPLSSTNYLFELDRMTQEIAREILEANRIGINNTLKVNNSEVAVKFPNNLNPIQINRLRKQFLNYAKINHSSSVNLNDIPQLFVQFINANVKCN